MFYYYDVFLQNQAAFPNRKFHFFVKERTEKAAINKAKNEAIEICGGSTYMHQWQVTALDSFKTKPTVEYYDGQNW